MSRRIQIYPAEAMESLFAAIPDSPNSARLNQMANAYMEIMDAEIAAVRWTEAQWCAVLDALNGAQIVVADSHEWHFAWANLQDSPDLDEKWNVDHRALAEEMRTMTVVRKIAVYEAAARFWSRSEMPTAAALTASGIKPIPRR